MKAALPLLYPIIFVPPPWLLDYFDLPEVVLILCTATLCLLPTGLLLYRKKWWQSVMTFGLLILWVVVSLMLLFVIAIIFTQDNQAGGVLGDSIEMNLYILNSYMISGILLFLVGLLVLSISQKLQSRIWILRQPLFVNALFGMTILVWGGINLTTQSTGPFGGETVEDVPTAIPLQSDLSQ
jgi:hypothetical protein